MEVRRFEAASKGVIGWLHVPYHWQNHEVVTFIERVTPLDKLSEAKPDACIATVAMPIKLFATRDGMTLCLDATHVSDEQLTRLPGWRPA